MSNGKELRALSSKVILPDGKVVMFDALSAKDRAEIRAQMCRNIEKRLGAFYAAHPDHFAALCGAMTQD